MPARRFRLLPERFSASASRSTTIGIGVCYRTRSRVLCLRGNRSRLSRILLRYVVIDEGLERGGKLVVCSFEGYILLPVNVRRAARSFTGSRPAYTNIRGLRPPRAIDYAPHHRQRHVLHAFILRLPGGHTVADVTLNRLGQFLKRAACRPPAAGARRHARRKRTQPQCLQQFASGVNFFAAITARFLSQ